MDSPIGMSLNCQANNTYRTTDWDSDLRVGGRWRATGRSKDGQAFSVEGEYLELEPPRKLVQSWKPLGQRTRHDGHLSARNRRRRHAGDGAS